MSTVRLHTAERLTSVVQYILREKAAEEHLSDAVFRGMDFKVECVMDLTKYAKVVRIAWAGPTDRWLRNRERRCLQIFVDDDDDADEANFVDAVRGKMNNISLRGEIYFFRLAKHFSGQLREVVCSKEGTVTVWFKNGMKVETLEDKIDSGEFLATCAMIYDIN